MVYLIAMSKLLNEEHATPYISIVTPCLNEERYIGGLLEDLCRQENFYDFEVIVVDSNSDDKTISVAESFKDNLNIQFIRLPKKGVSLARNRGAQLASGSFLLFLDADTRLPTTFLQTLAATQKETNAKILTTNFKSSGTHPIDRLLYFLGSSYFKIMFLIGQPKMTGCVMMVDKHLHDTVGGFNETIHVGEDLDYSLRLRSSGEKSKFVNNTKVIASNRRFVRDGRLSMLAWNWEWTTNKKAPFKKNKSYKFGHYDHK